MPDIDPSSLSRPAAGQSTTPIAYQHAGSLKGTKTSQIIPARIDLEPLYTALKAAIGSEKWTTYKTAVAEFVLGRLSQAEYQSRIDPIFVTPETEHLHNQLVVALYGNLTREMPDPELAPWVSTNDKPTAPPVPKPVTGDAAERRLKGEVMQLPNRDRRRIKDLIHNIQHDRHESLGAAFVDSSRRPNRLADATPQTGMGNMSSLEIRKRFTQPLAVESGEFPDVGAVEGRMLPICYDNALTNGHAPEAAKLLSLATETFIKEALASIFSRVRSNAPGEGGAASFGVGANWIRTHRYKRQLAKEEEAAMRGKITRDSSGFLPVEAKAASDRGPLSMTDLRIALSVADFGLAQFPAIRAGIINDYREGELESWASYSWLPGREPARATGREKQILARCSGPGNNSTAIATTITPVKSGSSNYMNGVGVDSAADAMEVDSDVFWHGAEAHDLLNLDSMLDSCLSSSTQPMWGV